MEGRGRGRAAPGEEAATRSRAGLFRVAETLHTIPPEVHTTTGDGQGSMRIVTNYFRLIVPKDQVVHSYRVDFEPQVEYVKVRRGLIYENRAVFDRAYVYDGGNEIKSLCKLNTTPVTVSGTRRDGSTVSITIKYTSTVSWGHPEMLRLYNTQMRRNLEHIGFSQVGRNYYNPRAKKIMQDHRLDIWPGILTAIAEHDGGIMMMCDNINKIIRHDTARDILNRIRTHERERWQEKARDELATSVVMTVYNNKTYKIDDIAFERTAGDFTFERGNTTTSLADYYRGQYNLSIRDGTQPLLLVQPTERQMRGGDKKEILLVPEFCLMTGLTDLMARDNQFKRALGDLTRLDPIQRAENLTRFIRQINSNERVQAEMGGWGLQFREDLEEIRARTLPPETILTHEAQVPYQQTTGSFEREIRSKRMIRPVALQQWVTMALKRDKEIVEEFFRCLRQVSGPLGVDIGPPTVVVVHEDSIPQYASACERVDPKHNLVIAIVPNNNPQRYSTIKRHFCCEKPIPSQVITTRVISNKKNLMSVATKILIQMSTKLGAEPWGIGIPRPGWMIVGYDTYHDSQRKGHSVGAFVCTSNSAATSWFCRTSYHQNRDELSGNFANNLKAGIKNWVIKNNGTWPERIIIYRDGVSEGQIPHVYNVEMREIQKLLGERAELAKTSFSFVIVTKRVNARFFHKVGEHQLQNPPPGTKIDSVVTRKERYDFYLISQSVRQGTVNPTMYNIIADNTGWSPINHQQLAYKLCHIYYNWAGTITVPAPCQYAHKLAFLTGTALHREHRQELSNTLFFL
ncbi:piwi-like protein 1 [Tetranychus urticae]|uniref:Piwi-like protein 1 n=1 Tax=Tetranychus urticae TaxID=32264 RepID=T1K7U4_TETUR|nr:piwi-like protein 1 [Tetranychus urticae]